MYLKEIVTMGFKSFADKLDIKLEDNITCIVGPNGSGKSNIVDAVRWVLGEQSVKSLRGDGSMSDVIFSGSKSRKESNVASVELIFDNNDHYLNIPYTDISIKRKVYRSGENEYYLNNERCRLKDITNLLLDSGIGKESFNIISQGEVDRILSNSSMERRVIFEEAAGILKYKKRKEEALRKLDRTHNNLDRVNDIISELELQVNPLKEQSIKAKEYLENKEGLEKYEVSLLAYDINNISMELEKAKKKKEKLEEEIVKLSNETNTSDVNSIKASDELEKLEKKLFDINHKLLETTQEVERINGEKNLIKERSSRDSKDIDIDNELRRLLEEKGNIERNIELTNTQIKAIEDSINAIDDSLESYKNNLSKLSKEKSVEESEYTRLDRSIISTKNRIDSLTVEIDAGGNIPNSVKSVIGNSRLKGIHNTIGNIIDVEDKYTKAVEIALSSSKNFIITDNESDAKEAINYLKDNHLGRATFFPISVIKRRYIDGETLDNIKNDGDYISILADLVSYEDIYEDIVYNQLGNVLVSPDMDSAIRLSKKINNRYRIVTLDGDVIHVGGSMSGGSSYSSKSIISLKQEVNNLKQLLKDNEESSILTKEKLEDISKRLNIENEKYLKESTNKVLESEKLNTKTSELDLLTNNLDNINKEIGSFKKLKNNTLSKEEERLIEEYNKKSSLRDKLTLESKELKEKIEKLKDSIEEQLASDKLKNANLRALEKEAQELEINITKYDVKLDNMLNLLNEEYEMTYERASSLYELDVDVAEARRKVAVYKSNIKRIGMVNLGAIEEYERVNTRYEFLTKQREDLLGAETTLLEIMNEMDGVMIEEFATTFEKVRLEFKNVFKKLFGGGNADLKLTNPSDLLTTGVDIVASPPGKKLTTINLLSGGEKTFAAISLLFAILNIKTVPFCLFDEVEAALDEANVVSFGKYLENYKNKTQFLIITHKKKTMEFADILYGITMQESGVSKLVSVKLNDKVEAL